VVIFNASRKYSGRLACSLTIAHRAAGVGEQLAPVAHGLASAKLALPHNVGTGIGAASRGFRNGARAIGRGVVVGGGAAVASSARRILVFETARAHLYTPAICAGGHIRVRGPPGARRDGRSRGTVTACVRLRHIQLRLQAVAAGALQVPKHLALPAHSDVSAHSARQRSLLAGRCGTRCHALDRRGWRGTGGQQSALRWHGQPRRQRENTIGK